MLNKNDFVWFKTDKTKDGDLIITDHWFTVSGDSKKVLEDRHMEQSMVEINDVVWTDENGGVVGVKRRFPFNDYTSIVNDVELLSILSEKAASMV